MEFSSIWHDGWFVTIVNHLWQSTLVAMLAWFLTLALKRNQAGTRYWVWMAASLKFFVPFSLFVAIGERLHPAAAAPSPGPIAVAVMNVARPLSQSTLPVSTDYFATTVVTPGAHRGEMLPMVLLTLWVCGFLFFVFRWARRWWAIRRTVRTAFPMFLPAHVPVFSSSHLLEPGVFGIFRPVLLLPEKIIERLTAPQLRSIVAHEMCHVRRRDNLTAAIHMAVEAIFWFHPAVWWIESRLIEERERACDETVVQSGNEAEVYAEGILNVCKFYVETPMTCMSGVTGSDLKQRIVRIMTEQVAHKLDLSRKLLLAAVGIAAVSLPMVFGLMHMTQVHAQTAAAPDTSGTWQGTLHAGNDLRIVLKISKDSSGYKATLYSIDQGGQPIPVKTVTQDGSNVKLTVPVIGGSYEGKLSADGTTITGTFTQGSPLPLVLTKATPATEWTIPTPPPPIPPMDANASPSFEVATIKPTKPDEQRKMFVVRGRQFTIVNQPLSSMISFAYGVHAKQVIGLPPWADTDKYDVEGVPDAEGMPNDKQLKGMLQKLLANRFQLKFHDDKKELPVYVLSVAKSGSKMTKSEGDPNGLPGLFFRQLGQLNVRNANMGDFAHLMQSAVLDRPVLDQTGLTGRFDFTLNWTPDDSQFSGMGAKVPPPTDGANAPPNLYTAIQEQIGLKLDATKAQTDVMVVDHVEQPSAN